MLKPLMATQVELSVKRKRRTKSRFVKYLEKSNDEQVQQLRLKVEQHKNDLIENNKQKYWSGIATILELIVTCSRVYGLAIKTMQNSQKQTVRHTTCT